MALIKRKNVWHVYFRGLHGKLVFRSTHCTDKLEAKAMEPDILQENREQKRKARIEALLGRAPAPEVIKEPVKQKRRLKLADMLDVVRKYRDVATDQRCAFERFIEYLPKSAVYADEINADIAFDYLKLKYGEQSGKAWNNNKTYLHSLFKAVLIDACMLENPFERIIQRRNDGQHQRPFSDDEVAAIMNAAPEPWKSACKIAFYTGLRQCDCFALLWNEIKGDIIEILPDKTRRYKRKVQIPIHSELQKLFKQLKRKDARVLGFSDMPYKNNGRFSSFFGKFLRSLSILDNSDGLARFNSFRNTFVSRCRKYKIAEHAIRGIAGHVDEEMTDLYSHDLTAAMEILKLPAMNTKLKTVKDNKADKNIKKV